MYIVFVTVLKSHSYCFSLLCSSIEYIDVGCFTAEDDIDDTTFVLHPVVPVGTTIGSLKGTDSYDPAVAMVEAMTKSVTPKGCDETGNVGLATYKWLSSTDFTTPVS